MNIQASKSSLSIVNKVLIARSYNMIKFTFDAIDYTYEVIKTSSYTIVNVEGVGGATLQHDHESAWITLDNGFVIDIEYWKHYDKRELDNLAILILDVEKRNG